MSVMQATLLPAETKEEKPIEGCKLGRALGTCPIRRKSDCGSLFDVMMFILPPFSIRVVAKERAADGDKDSADWLRRLDDLLPEQRPTLLPRRGDW